MARFQVAYSLVANNIEDAKKIAFDLCVEQTIEFPFELVKSEYIKNEIVGRIESLEKKDQKFQAVISYDEKIAGTEFTQFLNVIFGNSSIKPGIRIESLQLSENLLKIFSGPKFGVEGIRKLTGVENRPLLCSAIKPMGLSNKELAELAYRFALGGVDIIKDDHGLANQEFSPFEERIERCVAAVEKANQETGGKTIYLPNITADSGETIKRAWFVKKTGAKAVIISGALTGFDTVREVANDKEIGLPVFFHPAFVGSFTVSPDSGISHYALYGQLMRLAGADAAIFPNFGGRFSFSREECALIAAGCRVTMGDVRKSFPAPGGGISFENVKKITEFYGPDVIFLIGGGLFKYNPDITKSVRDLCQSLIR